MNLLLIKKLKANKKKPALLEIFKNGWFLLIKKNEVLPILQCPEMGQTGWLVIRDPLSYTVSSMKCKEC